MPDLVKLSFQLVDLSQYFSEAGNFGVGSGDGGLGAAGLGGDGALGLCCELRDRQRAS
jgi:hypothetical protein